MCHVPSYQHRFPMEMGCCCGGGFHRRFMSRKERIRRLEEYKKQLTEELKGIDELINELKGEKE